VDQVAPADSAREWSGRVCGSRRNGKARQVTIWFDLLLVDSERYLDLFQSKTQSRYGTDS